MYVAAIIDLHSRYVVGWSLRNTMEAGWIVQLIKDAFDLHGVPELFNSYQGSQFTSEDYINLLKGNNVQISMDSKGRATDNIFIVRLWAA